MRKDGDIREFQSKLEAEAAGYKIPLEKEQAEELQKHPKKDRVELFNNLMRKVEVANFIDHAMSTFGGNLSKVKKVKNVKKEAFKNKKKKAKLAKKMRSFNRRK